MRSFASDNYSGIHPLILKKIEEVNHDHELAYGGDSHTKRAIRLFKNHFGEEADVYFVFNGTAANVLGLKAAVSSYHSILCATTSHLNVDECGAPESFTGCKLECIETPYGKLTVDLLEPFLTSIGDQHHVQPKVISIAQTTELGTVYSLSEIRMLSSFAHRHGLLLHMDGARLSNAAASLNVTLRELTLEVGVDILSYGGTKNGMMCGEAIVFFNQAIAKGFKYIRKQGMQLASKMRFIAAQFEALLTDDLWLKNARHANRMAQKLAEEIKKFPEIKLARKVEANALFVRLPKIWIPLLQQEYYFYIWKDDPLEPEVRWMTSFDTNEADIVQFIQVIKKIINVKSK